MIQPSAFHAIRFKDTPKPRGCFPAKPRHLKHKGPGTAKSYSDRPGSGLLTRDEITRRRGGNPKGAY
jgi:hypothetical protein